MDTKDLVFEKIPEDQQVLISGTVRIKSMLNNNRTNFFKYSLTDKGVWLKNKNFLWIKGKETFVAYADIKTYKEHDYFGHIGFIFYPVSGERVSNYLIFDKTNEVEAILVKYIGKLARKEK